LIGNRTPRGRRLFRRQVRESCSQESWLEFVRAKSSRISVLIDSKTMRRNDAEELVLIASTSTRACVALDRNACATSYELEKF